MASFAAELAAVKQLWPDADTTKTRIISVPWHSAVIPIPAFDLGKWLNEGPPGAKTIDTIKIDIETYRDLAGLCAPLRFGYNAEHNILVVKVRETKCTQGESGE